MSELNTLTVYLGSSGNARPIFTQAALKLGEMIGKQNKKLIYGGMDAGLMGLLASAAMKSGGNVTGIIPQKLKDSERILKNLTETILVDDLWERKAKMFARADAVIALPGGFGTLDEALEVLYWAHLGLHNKPLVFVNIENYWGPIIKFLKPLPDFDARFLIVVDSVEEIFPALEKWKQPPPVKAPEHYPHFEDEISRVTKDAIMIEKPSIESTYLMVSALGLKQLGKHGRAIGFLNKDKQFDGLLEWFLKAAEERFITQKCLQLYAVAEDEKALKGLLDTQAPVAINLHVEKWGERRKEERQ
jgi:uncharacterized protein (TIGR00730 family)